MVDVLFVVFIVSVVVVVVAAECVPRWNDGVPNDAVDGSGADGPPLLIAAVEVDVEVVRTGDDVWGGDAFVLDGNGVVVRNVILRCTCA